MNELLAQEYIDEIENLKIQQLSQTKEIQRLRNENSIKLENIANGKVLKDL